MIRGDLSQRLIHLTRDLNEVSGEERFKQIMESKQINGGSNDIRGGYKCICFSEAPISELGQIIAKNDSEIRYSPFGFMFSKDYLYKIGARPVIYQSHEEYDLLNDEIKYKHVKFDLSNSKKMDWSWEREWRLKTDKLIITPEDVTLIVPNRQFIEDLKDKNYETNIAYSIIELWAAERFDWHFIVLEDLGYDFI